MKKNEIFEKICKKRAENIKKKTCIKGRGCKKRKKKNVKKQKIIFRHEHMVRRREISHEWHKIELSPLDVSIFRNTNLF